MNIKKSSWHYRFIKLHDFQPPKTLCSYFWMVVALIVTWGLLWWVIALIFIAVQISGWSERRNKKKSKKSKAHKEPGLVRAYISAKKQRVCPLIHIVESPDAS